MLDHISSISICLILNFLVVKESLKHDNILSSACQIYATLSSLVSANLLCVNSLDEGLISTLIFKTIYLASLSSVSCYVVSFYLYETGLCKSLYYRNLYIQSFSMSVCTYMLFVIGLTFSFMGLD